MPSRTITPKTVASTPLGLAEFRQHGPALIRKVVDTGHPLIFSTSMTPQLRMRSAELHPDEAAEIDEDAELTFTEAKAAFLQLRSAVMLGDAFLVSDRGKRRVILDRHPDFPHGFADKVRARWDLAARSKAHAVTRKHAKLASRATQRIEALLETLLEDFRGEQEENARDIVSELAALRSQAATLTAGDRKKLEERLEEIERKVGVLWFREGSRKDGGGRRPPDEGDLEKY